MLYINDGRVTMIPWKDYSKKMRPGVFKRIEKRALKNVNDDSSQQNKTSDSKKEMITNPNEDEYLQITPLLGVSQQTLANQNTLINIPELIKSRDTVQN